MASTRRLDTLSPHFLLLITTICLGFAVLSPSVAKAQYKSQSVGIEAGYQYIEDDFGLLQHGSIFGLRAGYKSSDHWWFTARALLSFRGDQLPGDRTNVLLHLTPVDVRYYLWTDSIRPYLGGATAFHFLLNSALPSTVQWGFGPVGGIEFKIRRDVFLGFQVDGLYMIAFEGEDVEVLNANMQLIFFL